MATTWEDLTHAAAPMKEAHACRNRMSVDRARRTAMVSRSSRWKHEFKLTRADQCKPPPNMKELATYLNVNGSICLDFTC